MPADYDKLFRPSQESDSDASAVSGACGEAFSRNWGSSLGGFGGGPTIGIGGNDGLAPPAAGP
ncbi:hypothetical protein, partial [Mycobacterium asiaticum]|uniref:hypothetical protein n=1 Tax=Mycobacterium asiaticum TaxID=1790 RepID=UPI000A61BF17